MKAISPGQTRSGKKQLAHPDPKFWNPPAIDHIEENLQRRKKPVRSAVVFDPHADDAELGLAAWMRRMSDLEISTFVYLVWPGYRTPALADMPLTDPEKTKFRIACQEAACVLTRSKLVYLGLEEAYKANYQRSKVELEQVTIHLVNTKPDLIFVPPYHDEKSHQAVRFLAAAAMEKAIQRSGFWDFEVITYRSTWRGMDDFNLYFPYDLEMAKIKALALNCFASERRQIPYPEKAANQDYDSLLSVCELVGGHHHTLPDNNWLRQQKGCELFRHEQFHPGQADDGDPIPRLLGLMRGERLARDNDA